MKKLDVLLGIKTPEVIDCEGLLLSRGTHFLHGFSYVSHDDTKESLREQLEA
jgi:hypothetical protein